MYKILTLNNISKVGLDRFPTDLYQVSAEVAEPDAIMLRSYKMHDMAIPASVKAVGRAGAGVNNIPVDKMSAAGIPVFNAPGANANAVKELVLAGMLLAARNVVQAWHYTRDLEGDDDSLNKQVEAGKKTYKGFELPGRTLGVIGLGAIGVKVANAALDLGMNVLGYDPQITVRNAWQLHSGVEQAVSVEDVMSRSDFLTLHVPLNEHTQGLVNAERIRLMPRGATVLNFARDGIVDAEAVEAALDEGRLHAYICDFPSKRLKAHPKVVALPHLGASTDEAEDNCAVMIAKQLREYLENGNISNSVNFPDAKMPRVENTCRIAIVNANVPNMVGQISTALANHELNIADLLNKSRGDLAYTLVDVDGSAPQSVLDEIGAIEGVLSVRAV